MNRTTNGDSKRIPLNRALSGRASDAEVMTEIIQRLAPMNGRHAIAKPEPLLVSARLLGNMNEREFDVLWDGERFTDRMERALRFCSLREALRVSLRIKKLRSHEYRILETSVITADEFRKGVANA